MLLLAWAVFIERVWFFFQFRRQLYELFDRARPLLREGKLEQAKGSGYLLHPLLENPYQTLFDQEVVEERIFRDRLERQFAQTRAGLGQFLWVLGTIGSSAPFIGLFGTVVGIIKSFESIAVSGKAGFSVVAGGLSEALIATAVGIIVAVMAIIFYNYLQVRLRGINLEFQHRMEDLAEFLVIYVNKR